jgi:hypothetical protein
MRAILFDCSLIVSKNTIFIYILEIIRHWLQEHPLPGPSTEFVEPTVNENEGPIV